MQRVSDMRVVAYEPLLSPTALLHELPLCNSMATAVELSRAEVRAAVLDGADDRVLVVAEPCSVHDPVAAIDYAARLAGAARPPRGTRSSASLTRGAPLSPSS